MGGRLDKEEQEEPNNAVCGGLEEAHIRYADVCGQEVLQYLEISEANYDGGGGESPRILKALSLTLERDIERNEKELAAKVMSSISKRDCNYNVEGGAGNSNYGSKVCKSRDELGVRMFNGVRAPSIGVESYIVRIHKYARCSPCCFVMAYAYMAKLFDIHSCCDDDNGLSISSSRRPMGLLTSLNVHRLLITTIMLAAKFMDDRHYNNAYYAKIGGVSSTEMNELEITFLKMVGYRLHIDPKEFDGLCLHLGKVAFMQTSMVRQPMLPTHPPPLCSFEKENNKNSTLVCTYLEGA